MGANGCLVVVLLLFALLGPAVDADAIGYSTENETLPTISTSPEDVTLLLNVSWSACWTTLILTLWL
jgi:hypothetical protein